MMLDYLLAVVGGILAWTFAEYALHHWVFHRLKFQTVGRREHLRHHSKSGYFTPTQLKLKLSMVAFTGVYAVMRFGVGFEQAELFTMTLGLSYAWYERVHNHHHTVAPSGPYGAWLRKHHFIHHFHDARCNHGVTTPIWDIVFGTYRTRSVVQVPRKFAMTWLMDERGSVKTRYADDYKIR